MKNLITLTVAIFFAVPVFAQTVDADEIIRKARNGDDIKYENVTIRGVVDLTPYMDEKDDLPRKQWFGNWDNKIETTIRGKISFNNCEFTDDFLAYYHDDRSEYTFVAHFDQDVVFKNCTFQRDAAFKYSEFDDKADFSGTTFEDDANFKYAEFNDNSSFADNTFKDDANFKYAEFEQSVDFSDSNFEEEANFKYAEMKDGVKFTNAVFDGLWNLKYAEMDDEVDLKGVKVNRDLDTKYTKINGRSFDKYLLSDN